MYVNLNRLKDEGGAAGELAAYLLSEVTDPKSDEVRKVSKSFNEGFDMFKVDKEVPELLSFMDRWLAEGRAEGEAIGRAEGEIWGMLATAINMVKLMNVTVTKAIEVANLPPQERNRLIRALEEENISYVL
jgi:hypothetical protein